MSQSVNPGSMTYTRVSALVLLAFAGSIARAQLNADQKSVLHTTHNERRSSVDASNMLQLVSSITILSFVLAAKNHYNWSQKALAVPGYLVSE